MRVHVPSTGPSPFETPNLKLMIAALRSSKPQMDSYLNWALVRLVPEAKRAPLMGGDVEWNDAVPLDYVGEMKHALPLACALIPEDQVRSAFGLSVPPEPELWLWDYVTGRPNPDLDFWPARFLANVLEWVKST